MKVGEKLVIKCTENTKLVSIKMATPFIDRSSSTIIFGHLQLQVCASNTFENCLVLRVATQAFKTYSNYLGLLDQFKSVKAQEL